MYWGIFTVSLFKFLHPFTQSMIEMIPVTIGEKILFGFVIYFVIDYTLTLIEVLNIQESVKMFLTLKDNSIVLATTGKIAELKKYVIKKSRRLIRTYPRLTYLSINRKLRDIVKEMKKGERNNKE
ncbi:MAG: hypothetical protein E7311_05740 [Clostridiales bacterium]|nr:hypothetical protein [Clostridiales bacterium]